MNVAALAKGTDILIYDSSYSDQELATRGGWGHSTWQEAIRIADAAGVRRLVVFHHDSSRLDDDMVGVQQKPPKRGRGPPPRRKAWC